ncbi:uncharacterized protein BcabD6B2_10280 [Babesia caballi]|uniref:Uncharacterized protein n=1 Tax=Babesia caballi TaxID=5871 RepID=A0AAV4LPD7_BABCB|nr:hypothetical protein BcabD6B2_10280 [Babesia caballi]
MISPQHTQERTNEHQHSVPQTLYWKVGYCNPTCTNFPILTIIPNELLKSLGQFGNETVLTITQSLLKLRTKFGIRLFNFLKKPLNLLGEDIVTLKDDTELPLDEVDE